MIVGHSKHELTQYKIHVVLRKKKLSYNTPTSPQGPHSSLLKLAIVQRVNCRKRQSSLSGARYNDTMIQCTSIVTMCRKDQISMRF